MLGKVTDLKPLTESEFTRHGDELLANSFNQGGFASSIDTQYTDSLTGANGKFHVMQNFPISITESDGLGFN